nr:hypothetical protein [Tanacetum cinerariifolium]
MRILLRNLDYLVIPFLLETNAKIQILVGYNCDVSDLVWIKTTTSTSKEKKRNLLLKKKNMKQLMVLLWMSMALILEMTSSASEWFTKECIGTISTWDDLVERFVLKFYNLCDHEETDDNNDPDVIDNVLEIFKINDDLFKFDSPLCVTFEELNHLLKTDPDLFTYEIQKIKTYDEYEQKLNNKTQGLVEP